MIISEFRAKLNVFKEEFKIAFPSIRKQPLPRDSANATQKIKLVIGHTFPDDCDMGFFVNNNVLVYNTKTGGFQDEITSDPKKIKKFTAHINKHGLTGQALVDYIRKQTNHDVLRLNGDNLPDDRKSDYSNRLCIAMFNIASIFETAANTYGGYVGFLAALRAQEADLAENLLFLHLGDGKDGPWIINEDTAKATAIFLKFLGTVVSQARKDDPDEQMKAAAITLNVSDKKRASLPNFITMRANLQAKLTEYRRDHPEPKSTDQESGRTTPECLSEDFLPTETVEELIGKLREIDKQLVEQRLENTALVSFEGEISRFRLQSSTGEQGIINLKPLCVNHDFYKYKIKNKSIESLFSEYMLTLGMSNPSIESDKKWYHGIDNLANRLIRDNNRKGDGLTGQDKAYRDKLKTALTNQINIVALGVATWNLNYDTDYTPLVKEYDDFFSNKNPENSILRNFKITAKREQYDLTEATLRKNISSLEAVFKELTTQCVVAGKFLDKDSKKALAQKQKELISIRLQCQDALYKLLKIKQYKPLMIQNYFELDNTEGKFYQYLNNAVKERKTACTAYLNNLSELYTDYCANPEQTEKYLALTHAIEDGLQQFKSKNILSPSQFCKVLTALKADIETEHCSLQSIQPVNFDDYFKDNGVFNNYLAAVPKRLKYIDQFWARSDVAKSQQVIRTKYINDLKTFVDAWKENLADHSTHYTSLIGHINTGLEKFSPRFAASSELCKILEQLKSDIMVENKRVHPEEVTNPLHQHL